jgi:hypothetical protein
MIKSLRSYRNFDRVQRPKDDLGHSDLIVGSRG